GLSLQVYGPVIVIELRLSKRDGIWTRIQSPSNGLAVPIHLDHNLIPIGSARTPLTEPYTLQWMALAVVECYLSRHWERDRETCNEKNKATHCHLSGLALGFEVPVKISRPSANLIARPFIVFEPSRASQPSTMSSVPIASAFLSPPRRIKAAGA